MRVDDWDEEASPPPPVEVAPPAAVASAAPVGAGPVVEAEPEAEAAPAARPKPPLSAVLPIYIIGIISISTICLMFAVIMVLIFTR